MNKPEPLSDEQISGLNPEYWSDLPSYARAIEAAVNRKWEEMLSKQEPVATLWREKNQKLYPGPSWMLTNSGKELPLGIEHSLYAAPVMAVKQEPVGGFIYSGNTWEQVAKEHEQDHDVTLLYTAPVDQAAEIERLTADNVQTNRLYEETLEFNHEWSQRSIAQQAEIARLKEQNYKLATAVGDQNRKFIAEQVKSAELLEALIRIRNWAEADKVNYTGDHPVAQARAAIAKALGEQK